MAKSGKKRRDIGGTDASLFGGGGRQRPGTAGRLRGSGNNTEGRATHIAYGDNRIINQGRCQNCGSEDFLSGGYCLKDVCQEIRQAVEEAAAETREQAETLDIARKTGFVKPAEPVVEKVIVRERGRIVKSPERIAREIGRARVTQELEARLLQGEVQEDPASHEPEKPKTRIFKIERKG